MRKKSDIVRLRSIWDKFYDFAKDDTEIAILSRSMLEILLELSSYVDVPEAHVAEQRAGPTRAEDKDIAADL